MWSPEMAEVLHLRPWDLGHLTVGELVDSLQHLADRRAQRQAAAPPL